jgi:hypothetical protein
MTAGIYETHWKPLANLIFQAVQRAGNELAPDSALVPAAHLPPETLQRLWELVDMALPKNVTEPQ